MIEQPDKTIRYRTHPKAPICGSVQQIDINRLRPSPENDELYRPVDPDDPAILDLAENIRQRGVMEALICTLDYYILSGHRRHAAAKLAGLATVPVSFKNIMHSDPEFVNLLADHNRQREKNDAEKLREVVVALSPEEAYKSLKRHRAKVARVDVERVEIIGTKTRSAISKAKEPFLEAILKIINELRYFWPLTIRQIHYQLLNDPPLTHASKLGSHYQNLKPCYKMLCDLAARARLEGKIAMNAIADETRPVTLYDGFDTTTAFIRRELDGLLKGYYRNLQQTQPNHIEIVGEKNTVQGIIKPIASEYTLPMTIGRGYCSLQPRYDIAQRFKKSGKGNLILLVLSDFDPDGEEICHSLARSLRDDFDIENIKPVKVGLTESQVREMNLIPNMEAKTGSPNYQKFKEKYGENVFELEAIPPFELQRILRETIESVMDMEAFESEIENEEKDAQRLDTISRTVRQTLQEAGVDMDDEGEYDEKEDEED